MEFLIREANVQDASGIARVHVNSWIETYTGIVPDSYLSTLSKAKRQEMWESIISSNKSKQYTFVAEVNGEIIGFVNGGEAREKEHGFEGELCAIYLLQSHQGQKIGKAMFQKLTESIKNDSMKSMYLWVLRDNSTIKFYKGMGGTKGTEKVDEIGGKELLEDLYYWENI
jgi:L-amino acid N-acyltransferase YncA